VKPTREEIAARRDELFALLADRAARVRKLRSLADNYLAQAVKALDAAKETASPGLRARFEELAVSSEEGEARANELADEERDRVSEWAGQATYIFREIELLDQISTLAEANEKAGRKPFDGSEIAELQRAANLVSAQGWKGKRKPPSPSV
jgi:hypothetical protein